MFLVSNHATNKRSNKQKQKKKQTKYIRTVDVTNFKFFLIFFYRNLFVRHEEVLIFKMEIINIFVVSVGK